MNNQSTIPVSISLYLHTMANKITIDEAFAYLIKSVDGDSHYLCTELVEDEHLNPDIAEATYESVMLCSYRQIFEWREMYRIIENNNLK